MSANLMDSGEATFRMIQEFLGHQRKATTEDHLKTLDREAIDVADIIDSFDQKSEQNSAQHEE